MSSRDRSLGRWALFGIGAAVVLAIAGTVLSGAGETGPESANGAPVRRGALTIRVVERGNLKAKNSVNLKSELEGQSTILWLIEEGKFVEAGDLVCELDASQIVERRVSQEIGVQNAEATWVKAKQNHEIQESTNGSDIAAGDRAVEFAELDIKKYVDGDWPQALRDAEEAILVASEELTLAKQDLDWSEKLHAKGFLETTQLDADRLSHTRAEVTQAQRERALELLREYDHPRRLKELEADVEEANRELERIHLRAKARLIDFESDVKTSKAKLDLEREQLAKMDEQIAKARMFAPIDGFVVYAQEGRSRFGNGEPMQEGAPVRERQDIVTIPQTGGMVAQASLHESVLEKVEEGMACLVEVDALPGRRYRGRVSFKALLPDQNSWWANPDLRVYRTEILIEDAGPEMRPGMSCSVEIMVDRIEDCLYVPLQAVFLDGGAAVAFVANGGEPEMRAVEAGRSDGKWVEVVSGLAEGEIVLLTAPSSAELRPAPATDVDDGGEYRPPIGGGESPGGGEARVGEGKVGGSWPREGGSERRGGGKRGE